MATTIQILEPTKERLESLKHSKRETYDEIIRELIELAEEENLELSEKTKKELKIAREEIKKGKVLTTKELIMELGV
jgi:predicted transcriptional regulator